MVDYEVDFRLYGCHIVAPLEGTVEHYLMEYIVDYVEGIAEWLGDTAGYSEGRVDCFQKGISEDFADFAGSY